MSEIRLDPGASEKRPANPWFWSAIAGCLVLMVWGLVALTSRPKSDASAPKAIPPPAAAPSPAAPSNSAPPTAKAAPPPPLPTPTAAPAVISPPAPAPTPTPVPLPSAAGNASLAEAEQLKSADDYSGARAKLLQILAANPDAGTRERAETLLGEVGIGLVTTPRQMPEKSEYIVVPGDTISKIAQKFGTTQELLMKSNGLTGPMLRVKQHLRVFTGKFRIQIDKSDNTLTLFLNDTFFKRYRVGTGQYNRTPVGNFKVTDRIPQPPWWRPDGKMIPYGDPENLLGTHWLAIDEPGYGIHGTWDPNTIGKQSSAGCVRLVNSDIEELFTLIPVGTPVTIED